MNGKRKSEATVRAKETGHLIAPLNLKYSYLRVRHTRGFGNWSVITPGVLIDPDKGVS